MNFINRTKRKFGYAIKGLHTAFTADNSFKIHFAVAIPIIISGFILSFDRFEWIVISFTIGQVLVAELFNTAIEFVVKMCTDEYNKFAEKLLNISAGAVLMSVIISIIIGCFIYIPYLIP